VAPVGASSDIGNNFYLLVSMLGRKCEGYTAHQFNLRCCALSTVSAAMPLYFCQLVVCSRSCQSTLRATRSAVRNSPSFFDESIPM